MKKEDVVGGMLAYIAHLREVGRYSTAKSYLDALRSFKCFCGMEEIPYAYIDKERLLLYQAWLSKRGCMRNTVSTYMRRIRHIYNLAVEAGEVSYIPNLFKGVFTGVESKRKKALPLDSLRSLIGLYLYMPVFSAWVEKASGKAKRMFLAFWFISLFIPYLTEFELFLFPFVHKLVYFQRFQDMR